MCPRKSALVPGHRPEVVAMSPTFAQLWSELPAIIAELNATPRLAPHRMVRLPRGPAEKLRMVATLWCQCNVTFNVFQLWVCKGFTFVTLESPSGIKVLTPCNISALVIIGWGGRFNELRYAQISEPHPHCSVPPLPPHSTAHFSVDALNFTELCFLEGVYGRRTGWPGPQIHGV